LNIPFFQYLITAARKTVAEIQITLPLCIMMTWLFLYKSNQKVVTHLTICFHHRQ